MKKTKRVVAALLSVVLILTTIPTGTFFAVAATTDEFSGGTGSTYNPYIIETKEQLNNIRNYPSSSFKLNSNLIFTEEDFSETGLFYNNGKGFDPIGSYEEPFTGTFDGNNHYIKGLYINIETTTKKLAVGLFGYTTGTISNLGVADGLIRVKTSASMAYVTAGGIAGDSEKGVDRCYNSCNVEAIATGPWSVALAGGLIGTTDGTITNSYNAGKVYSESYKSSSGESYAGGIVAKISGYVSETVIQSCLNVGDVSCEGTTTYYGAIAGYSYQGKAMWCYYKLYSMSPFGNSGAQGSYVHGLNETGMATERSFDGLTDGWRLTTSFGHPTLSGIEHIKTWNYSEFAGGVGTQDEPYLIETKEHLNNIRNYLNAHYKVIADIMFTDADFDEGGDFYNNGQGWEHIGSKTNAFTGVFDGNGKTISKLKINSHDASEVYTGLFGYNCGDISGISLVNMEINAETTNLPNESKAYVGGVAGYSSGKISNCVCSGSITTKSFYSHTGGIVGYLESGSITNCHNTANVTGSKSYSDVGGIVGYSKEYITDCSNTGNVEALTTYSNAGGIVAYQNGGYIKKCYNLGSVSAVDSHHLGMYAGGITGYDWEGEIVDCFNIGSVRGSQDVGGVAGYLYYGTIQTCYNLGEVTGTGSWKPGGIVAAHVGNISNCYYMNNINSGVGTGLDNCVKCTPEEMFNIDTYEGFDFQNVWEFKSNNAFAYPILRSNPYFKEAFEGGSGTENDPYLIKTAEQLNRVRNYQTAYFKMISDITFTDADFEEGGAFYNSGNGWLPIGTDYNSPFTGCFDGNNHEISNLFINITQVPENGQVFAGLFGYGNGCQISNLSLKNSDITVDVNDAAVSVGAILGRTDEFGTGAVITNCTNDGKIFASTGNVGGIAGSFEKGVITGCKNYGTIDASTAAVGGIISYLNDGAITNCQNYSIIGSNATITGICGGIVASSWGNTETCTNNGNITSSYDAGGIVGSNWGLIDHCENYGKITAKYSAGGIASVSAAVQNNDTTCGIKNCINNGIITAGIASDDMYHITAGGIAGSIQNGIVISNSWNYGEVLSQTELVLDCNAGGIVGYNSGGSISKCGNTGNITAKTERYARGGGIVGCNCGGNIPVVIDQCVNQGTVYSPIGNNGVCGGIAGDNFDTATISNCFNIGAVTSSSRPGGIIGLADNNTIRVAASYNIGTLTTLTPNQWIGGSNANITNCFYLNGDNYTSTVITGYAAGNALSVTEMTNADSFLGFDFNSTWTMEGNDEYPYPELQEVELSYNKELQDIVVYRNPIKTTYLEGKDVFDVSGGKILLIYNYGVREVIDMTIDMISGYDNTNVGQQVLTVEYGGHITTFEVTIKSKALLYIEVTELPTKQRYLEGESFNAAGMIITAHYDNDTSNVVSDYTVGGYTSTPGNKTITITHYGKAASFNVIVEAKTLTSISVTTKPNKTLYLEGEAFDKTGIVVTAYYNNNTSEAITDYSISGYTSTLGTKIITITYGGKTDTFTVEVAAKSVVSILVTTKPNKLIYLEGEALDTTGMVVTAYYDNNTSAPITSYSVSGYNSTRGTKTITVTYNGKTATFTVTVNSRVPSTVTSSKHTITGNNISKITAGTTVSSLLSGLNEGSYCKVYKGNSEVSGSTVVGTGMVVKIMDGNTVKASYTVIVTGDTNGDGAISVTDMIAIKAHILNKSTLTGVYATAANTNGDSGISITDFIQVKAKILGKGNITAR